METAPAVTDAASLASTAAGATDLQELIEAAWAYIQEEEDPELAG